MVFLQREKERKRFFLQREKERKRFFYKEEKRERDFFTKRKREKEMILKIENELRNENKQWIKNVRRIENENSNAGIYKKFLGLRNFLDRKIPKIPLILFIPYLLNP